MADFYERVTELCREKGLSVSALERRADLGAGTLAKFKDGRMPRIWTIAQAAMALGVEMSDLIPPSIMRKEQE